MTEQKPLPYIARLMRLYKPTGDIAVMTQVGCLERGDYRWLWRVVGGDGVAHPHPDCKYWIEDAATPARFTGDAHIVRSEN